MPPLIAGLLPLIAQADAVSGGVPGVASGVASGGGGSPYPELATISGIVAATLVAVEVLKKLLADVPVAGSVPTWVYAVASSAVLVLVARFGLGTLAGDAGPLLWQAALLAGSASGFYSWLREPGDNPTRSAVDRSTKAAQRDLSGVGVMVLVAAVSVGAIAAGGCQLMGSRFASSPQQQVLAAREAYTATLDALIPLRRAGLIDDDDARQIESLRVEAAVALNLAESAAAPGSPGSEDFRGHLDTFNRVLDRLIERRLELEQRDDGTGTAGDRSGFDGRGGWRDPHRGTFAGGGWRPDAGRDRGGEGATGQGRCAVGVAVAPALRGWWLIYPGLHYC